MDNLVLVGFMGAGKTAVGREAARRLGMAFVDTDDVCRQLTGLSPAGLIDRRGEAGFRLVEQRAVELCSRLRHTVIATGGGAVISTVNCERLASSGSVIYLRASADTLGTRVGDGSGRPLWSTGAAELLQSREPGYLAAADFTIDTDDVGVDCVVDRLIEATGRRLEPVTAAEPIVIGVVDQSDAILGIGVSNRIDRLLGEFRPRRVAIVSEPVIHSLYGAALQDCLMARGTDTVCLTVQGGEGNKNLSAAGDLLTDISRHEFNRDDALLALGGGVVNDLVGFAASVYMRGMDVIQVPTTLLAAVDAALGGKTGVNHTGVKNLVGTFHQPRLIVIDPLLLRSLPDREFRSGLGELVKYGVGFDPGIVDLMTGRAADLSARCPDLLLELIKCSVEIKADICRQDTREAGPRMLLNLGHTIGHALESLPALDLTHGEAVAVGLVAAGMCSEVTGVARQPVVDRITGLLTATGLPTGVDWGAERDRLMTGVLSRLGLDKKRRRGVLNMVLLEDIGRPVIRAVPIGTVAEVLPRLGL